MANLGDHVVFKVPAAHRSKTIKTVNGERVELAGSIHHPELAEFAGVVGAVNPDGTYHVLLFVPNREPKWVDSVGSGDGEGQFLHVDEAAFERSREKSPEQQQAA